MKRKTVKVEEKAAPKKTAFLRGRVPAELKTKVLNLAKSTDSSESRIVRKAVTDWLTRQGEAA